MNSTIFKSNVDQAIASWINYINQLRLNKLVDSLKTNNSSYQSAIKVMDESLNTIKTQIVENGGGRGGATGLHGFISEISEVGFGNAKSVFDGNNESYSWLNNNSSSDISINGINYQMKFCESGGLYSFDSVLSHLEKYPDYLKVGNKYIIPKDHYEELQRYLSISEYDANRIPTNNNFSLRKWRRIKEISKKIPIESIEPSEHSYSEVQKGTYEKTIQDEKDYFKRENDTRNRQTYERSKPSLSEGTKATIASAGIEGATNTILEIINKRKNKKFNEFTDEDWKDVAIKGGKGTITGAIRGASVYMFTNYTATPAFVASSFVTASLGISEQTYLYKKGKITLDELYLNSESLCVECTVSALSSLVGQLIIPIPILGAVIGNTIGLVILHIVKDFFDDKTKSLYDNYFKELVKFESVLEKEFLDFKLALDKDLDIFLDLSYKCFDVDCEKAFYSSVEIAKQCGVEESQILKNTKEIDNYFLN